MSDFQRPSVSALTDDRGDLNTFPPLGEAIKVLMIWPRFPPSFWSFAGMTDLLREETVHPPLGLLTLAALCPKNWKLRLIDRSFEALHDRDILWADLVMVSGMSVQRDDIRQTLLRARALGKRTMIGGPYASSEPGTLLPLADHVVVGEPDEIFDRIAADLERGSAQRLYVIHDKPDVSKTPVPRFDLLKIEKYVSMAVQFSRGCPFQCEFCDIITLYGRKPRTKAPRQLLAELDALFELGWREQVFIVDDNFIGNHKRALELARNLEKWQVSHDYPFLFYTEASIDLAQRPELIEAMVRANFYYVFIGIESPSEQALMETKKYQNLRHDQLESIRFIQSQGLWVTCEALSSVSTRIQRISSNGKETSLSAPPSPGPWPGSCKRRPRLRSTTECWNRADYWTKTPRSTISTRLIFGRSSRSPFCCRVCAKLLSPFILPLHFTIGLIVRFWRGKHGSSRKRRPIRSCSHLAFWFGQSSVKASSPPIGERTGSSCGKSLRAGRGIHRSWSWE